MHTSLDQALGRNPRLNRVGQSLLNIASGASAAYSLRSLTGDDPNVVRVRRDSDNAERDFTASEVSSGELERWVNVQATLPLDLRTLQADGRTGAIIDAKAAYSLRNLSSSYTGNVVEVRRNVDGSERDFTAAEVSDGTLTTWVNESFNDALPLDTSSGASAAYSLRNLSSSYSGNVVEVRRSSDDAEQSFTASQVSNGTLTDWVNTNLTPYTQTGELNIPSGSGTYVSLPSNTVPNTIGHTFRISFKLKRNTGGSGTSGAISVRTTSTWNYTTSEKSSNLTEKSNRFEINTSTEEYQTYSFTCSTNAGSNEGSLRFQTYDSDDSYTVKDFSIEIISSNGHVKTWYDQSGSSNNATQSDSSKQPTIVSNGSLQQDADGNTAVKFDGTDDYLVKADASPELFGPYTFFTHTDRDGDNGNPFSITGDADLSARYFAVDQNANDSQFNPRSNTSQTVSQTGLTGTEVRLTTVNTTSDTSYSVGTNGAAFTTGTTSYGTMPADPDGCPRIIIGKLREGATLDVQIFGGFITEIIAYAGTTNGDQSTKRRAIEENIANHYGITLASFSRDGFVKTWYDQSSTTDGPYRPANNNHATQSDSSKQPKIVEGGAYLGEIKFESGLYLDKTGLSLSGPFSTFSVSNANSQHSGALLNFGNFSQQYRSNRSLLLQYGDLNFSSADVYTVGEQNVMSFIFDSTSLGYYNGTEIINDAATGATATQFRVGNSSFGLDGDVKEVIIYNSNQTDNRTALEANIGEHYSISGIPAYDNTVNGFVETWYDQSGSDNNATQTSADAQPKIVNAGTKLDHLLFDGGNDFLSSSGFAFSPSGDMLISSVQKLTTGQVYDTRDGADDGIFVQQGGTSLKFRYNGDGSVDESGNDDLSLATFEIDGTTMTVYKNGSSVGTDTVVAGLSTTADLNIGKVPFSNANYANGQIHEIVMYASDQSAKRSALESNIAAANGITLS